MAFPTDDILLGPASFGRLHRLDGLIWHTGEEPAFTRAYAVSTAVWQRTHPGSYNFRVYDRASDPRGVMLNVPWLEASGGINPSSTAWAPGRYPFLRAQLPTTCHVAGCPGPYRNPTMHHLQVSFVGTTARLNAGAAPANFLLDALALIEWAEDHPLRGPKPLVLSKHGHWQSNRSDCGDWMYSRLAPETDMPTPTLHYVPQLWRARAGGAALREQASDLAPVIARVPAGSVIFTLGENQSSIGWRLGLAGSPERLYFVKRAEIDPLPPTPRDEALYTGIAEVVNARADGKPVPHGDTTQLQAALDSANKRTASVKTAGATSIRKLAAANRDLAASGEAAAKNLEAL